MKNLFMVLSLLNLLITKTNAQSGYLDLTFCQDGIFTADLGINDFYIMYQSTLQADSKILLTGISNGDFSIMRLLPDETPDPQFGNNGLVLEDIMANLIVVTLSLSRLMDAL